MAPQQVETGLARTAPLKIALGRFNRSLPEAPNYSPNGVNGDPTLASQPKGELLANALLAEVLDMPDEFSPPPAAAPVTPGSG